MTLENNSHKPQDVSQQQHRQSWSRCYWLDLRRGNVKKRNDNILTLADFRTGHQRIKCDIPCTVVIIIATAVTVRDGVIDGNVKIRQPSP